MSAAFGSTRALTHREHGWLIAQLALVLAPLLRSLPLVTCGVFGVLLLWRLLLWVRRAPLPGKWLLGAVGIAVLAATVALALRTGGNLGRDLSVALLGAFLVLKLMESHTVRNGVLVTQLCCFLLLSQTLFDQPPWLAATLLASLALKQQCCFTTGCCCCTRRRARGSRPRGCWRGWRRWACRLRPCCSCCFLAWTIRCGACRKAPTRPPAACPTPWRRARSAS
jgi:hypothetical protein